MPSSHAVMLLCGTRSPQGAILSLPGYAGYLRIARSEELAMSMSLPVEAPPLTTDADGVVRVGGTRVTLDTVVAAFSAGATPEQIAQQFPSVSLADAYQVIAYYLRRPSEVEGYLQQQTAVLDAARANNEPRFDPAGVRARLLARRRTGHP
jgi:uncharacterized protein (DUF433 family)